jgi:hypothetical protein
MSYSRWSNSRWYTFYTSTFSEETELKFPTKNLKNNQYFEICDDPSLYFSYGDIKHLGMENILLEVKLRFIESSDDELSELEGYIERFINDIDEQFKLKNFFYDNWYLVIKRELRKIF